MFFGGAIGAQNFTKDLVTKFDSIVVGVVTVDL